MDAAPSRHTRDRFALGVLTVTMALGSLLLWTVVPLAALWAVSSVGVSSTMHLGLSIIAVPAAIIVFATALMRLNGLYVRIATAPSSRRGHDGAAYSRGPLEWLIVGSLTLALITLVVWMVFISNDPFPWTTPTALVSGTRT